MCGITACLLLKQHNIIDTDDLYSLFTDLFESMFHLQHRGQDSVGLFIKNNTDYQLIKKEGLINKINWNQLKGTIGIGHIRYSTNNGEKFTKLEQAQPIIFHLDHSIHTKIVIVHNGHIKNNSFINTYCKDYSIHTKNMKTDSELFLHIFVNEIYKRNLLVPDQKINFTKLQNVIEYLCLNIPGAYNIILYIDSFGLIAFKDHFGIRPLCYGKTKDKLLISSESISLKASNYKNIKELYPNEILFYNEDTNNFIISNTHSLNKEIKPCVFEWIYLARAESIIYNVPVYEVRLKMGEYLATHIQSECVKHNIDLSDYDYVVPVPDTSRPYALSISKSLNIPYVEGIIKNRYIFRTFIMDSQYKRQTNVKRKLNCIPKFINNKNIILVDDSIVRGNTMRHIVNLLKSSNVGKVIIISCSPEIKSPNYFGIDIPDKNELISFKKSSSDISKEFGVEKVFFQTKANLLKAIQYFNSEIKQVEQSIFD